MDSKILKVPQPGPAFRYMRQTDLKYTYVRILDSVGKVQKGKSANLTLHLAIKGAEDAHQCKTCCKYFNTRESALRHVRRKKGCKMSGYTLCTKNDRYFCYIDGKEFESKLQLLTHYAISHTDDEDQLKAWGLSLECMTEQALLLNDSET